MPGGGITVIGAGVVGMSAAILLAERGHPVTLLAEDVERTASGVAAALWSPALVERSERVRAWAYETLARLRRDAPPGVREQESLTLGELPWVPDAWMAGFAPSVRDARADERPAGYAAGRVGVIPLVDTTRYLPWLRERADALGVRIVRRRLDALSQVPGDGPVLVAAGLGSAALVQDAAVRAVRTQVVRLSDPGLARTTIVRDGPLGPLFVIPRGRDVVVGGGADAGPTPDPAVERELCARASAVAPALAEANVLGRAVGARPVRELVRVEREQLGGRVVVHCYGHGGAGIALSWGSARAAVELVEAA